MCNPSPGNSLCKLLGSHHDGSSQWMLFITGILNRVEQICTGALGVLTLVLPAVELPHSSVCLEILNWSSEVYSKYSNTSKPGNFLKPRGGTSSASSRHLIWEQGREPHIPTSVRVCFGPHRDRGQELVAPPPHLLVLWQLWAAFPKLPSTALL